MTAVVEFLLFASGLFGVFGLLAYLADRPSSAPYPDRWTD